MENRAELGINSNMGLVQEFILSFDSGAKRQSNSFSIGNGFWKYKLFLSFFRPKSENSGERYFLCNNSRDYWIH